MVVAGDDPVVRHRLALDVTKVFFTCLHLPPGHGVLHFNPTPVHGHMFQIMHLLRLYTVNCFLHLNFVGYLLSPILAFTCSGTTRATLLVFLLALVLGTVWVFTCSLAIPIEHFSQHRRHSIAGNTLFQRNHSRWEYIMGISAALAWTL